MAIEVKNIVKRFGSFAALDNVDLKVADGELLALLGPSGSGKTTLLRIIAGLDWPDSGEVAIDGEKALQPRRQRAPGRLRVPALRAVPPHDGVRERRLRPARAAARDPQGRGRRSAPASRNCSIWCSSTGWPIAIRASCPAASASASRWRARSRSSRASCCSTSPSARSTPKCARSCRQWLRSLHNEIHVTSIFVTHDQEEALEVANRVVVMDKGRIEQIGSPGEVYDNPATAFVHGFIGESIVLPVDVAGDAVRLDGRPLNIPATGAASGAAKLFVRRHDMADRPGRHRRAGRRDPPCPLVRPDPARRGRAVRRRGQDRDRDRRPRDRELQAGEIVSLQPRRYRIFAAQD